VQQSAELVFGPGRLIDPTKLTHVFISPRQRAQQTWKIFAERETNEKPTTRTPTTTTEDLAEWDYGLYEGRLTHEIRKLRYEHGLDGEKPWDIWRDGCEDGETPQQVTSRLDSLITKIKDIHRLNMHYEKDCDVVLVAHGHILRAFVKRWLGYALDFPLSMMLEPGGVCGLSYQHNSIEEPACLIGMSFPNPTSLPR
jgi:sedoheptulose-bisphosphatase